MAMHEQFLNRARNLVIERHYAVTAHAYDEMAADDLTVWTLSRRS